MNSTALISTFRQLSGFLGGGVFATLIAMFVVLLVLYLVYRSGKQITFKVPFLPPAIGTVKFGKKKGGDASLKGEAKSATVKAGPLANDSGLILDSLAFLNGKNETRYQTPIYLLLGNHTSNLELLNGLDKDIRATLQETYYAGSSSGGSWLSGAGCLIAHEFPHYIVSGLLNSRPERPLDGLILTVSVRDLLQDERAAAESLYRQFWMVRDKVGFILPVYLLVTDCESLEGFSEFWLSERNFAYRDNIFGWSKKGHDGPFDIKDIAEAVEHVLAVLRRHEMGLLVSDDQNTVENAFLFCNSIVNLQDRIVDFCRVIFSDKSASSRSMFRGLYFSGSGRTRSSTRILLKDLFYKKIFPESYLAYPEREQLLSTNKKFRKAQYLLLVLGLWMSYALISDLQYSNSQNRQLLAFHETLEDLWDPNNLDESVVSAVGLLSTLSASESYCCGIVPVTLVSRRNAVLESFFRDEVYESLMFPAVECGVRQLMAEDLNLLSAGDVAGRDIAAFHQWLSKLQDDLSALAKIDEMIAGRTQLAAGDAEAAVEDFAKIYKMLYGVVLPDGFYIDSDMYVSALLKDQSIDPNKNAPFDCPGSVVDEGVVLTKALDLAQGLVVAHRLEVAAPIEVLSKYVSFDNVARDDIVVAGSDMAKFRSWYQLLSENWIVSADQNICNETYSLLSNLSGSVEVSPNSAAGLGLETFVSSCISAIRDQMLRDNAQLNYRIYDAATLGEDFQPAFTEGSAESFKTLVATGDLSFTSTDWQINAQLNEDFSWNVDELNRSLGFAEEYLAFAGATFTTPYLSDDQKDGANFAQAVLLAQLQTAMAATIESSKTVRPTQRLGSIRTLDVREAQIADRVSNFRRALNPLLALINTFEQLGFANARQIVLKDSQRLALSILESIDDLYQENLVYQPRVRVNWSANSFTESFYGLVSDGQAKDYLAAQSLRTRLLALQYATPIITYLASTDGSFGDPDIISRWTQTLVDINKQQNKDPSNEGEYFDQFFLGQFAEITLDNCFEKTQALESPQGNSLFSISMRNLIARSVSHCDSYRIDTISKDYERLSELFNSLLAPYYPYTQNDGAPSLSPSRLKTFLDQYEGSDSGLADRLRVLSAKYPQFAGPSEFVRELDSTISILQNFVGVSSSESSQGIQLIADFNVDAGRYNSPIDFANHVSQWTFQVGDGVLVYPGVSAPLFWRFQDDISLTFDWAEGSPYLPLLNNLPVIDNKVEFVEESNWSLLRFISAHHSSVDDENALTNGSMLLEFNFDTAASLVDARTNSATLYLRLSLLGVDPETKQNVPLSIPAVFPNSPPKI